MCLAGTGGADLAVEARAACVDQFLAPTFQAYEFVGYNSFKVNDHECLLKNNKMKKKKGPYQCRLMLLKVVNKALCQFDSHCYLLEMVAGKWVILD
jgi:hypothetical protein